MNVASEFAGCSLDNLKALLDGGTLTVYSVARPTAFAFIPEGGWPERPDYYDSHPHPGFAMPMIP
ncbi:hypothetical protein [Bradyrhizobium cenepequi]